MDTDPVDAQSSSNDSGSSSSGSGSGSGSTVSSTKHYEQEHYETWSEKALQALRTVYPTCERIELERMKGGGFNRVVGATLSNNDRVVLRAPRFKLTTNEIVQMASDIAVLEFLENLANVHIPVPHVVHYDLTEKNPLEWTYSIQKRVAGQRLDDRLHQLTQIQYLDLVKTIAETTAAICAIQFPKPGLLTVATDPASGKLTTAMPNHSGAQESSNTLEYLLKCFDYHEGVEMAIDPHQTFSPPLYAKLRQIAQALERRQPFSNRFCLFHNDFESRNIQVTDGPDGKLKLEAIFDWDDSCSAPIEVAYVAPHWLWTWYIEDNEELSVKEANAAPKTPKLRAVKKRFEKEIEARVPGFMKMWRTGETARGLYSFALKGVGGNEDASRIKQLFEEVCADSKAG